MKGRPYNANPFRSVLVNVIRGTDVSFERLWGAFLSLSPEDRDRLRYVPRLLALEA